MIESLERHYLERFAVRVGERFLLLRMEEIRWLESMGSYVRVHAVEATYTLRESLTKLETLLDPKSFLRISRGAVINLDRVRFLERWFHGDYRIVLDDGQVLRSTRAYRSALQRLVKRQPADQAD